MTPKSDEQGAPSPEESSGPIHLARVYDEVDPTRTRVLVDRLWPRGMHKEDPRVGTWLPKVAPSTELRHWYNHRPEVFDEFAQRYAKELTQGEAAEAFAQLQEIVAAGPVTLVTATKFLPISQAPVLQQLLEARPD